MKQHRLSGIILVTIAALALLSIAACGVTSVSTGPGSGGNPTATPIPPTATATSVPPTATATLTPPNCGSGFSSGYYNQLPNPHYTTTQVYADIPLPPQSRIRPDDASGGQRGYDICSAGTVASITAYMNAHLSALGWTNAGNNTWKKDGFSLEVMVSSPTDWLIGWHDPDFH